MLSIASTDLPRTIDPNSPLPLSFQLRELLRASITAPGVQPDTVIPGEVELERRYGLSRTTVRQAVLALVHEGLLYRKRGKGTFVAPRKVEESLNRLRSLAEELQDMGIQVLSHTISAALESPGKEVAAALELEPGAQIFVCKRVRLAEGYPIALENICWAEPAASRLLEQDLDHANFYEIVEKVYGVPLVEAEQTIEGRLATDREARLLQVERPAVVLQVRRLTRTRGGRPIELNTILYDGSRYKYRILLHR